jgi:16S rRNA (guanine527-N7)-methyltransferase
MEIEGHTRETLVRFVKLLANANNKVRLTGPSDEKTIYEEHIEDALRALSSLEKFESGHRFVDVGTGGGLPGVVWGICRPDMEGVLIDSVGKKINILREIVETLGLQNITALNMRSEELALQQREKFDVATARAVADAKVMAEYLSPLVKIGGRLVIFKGSKVSAEIDIPRKDWKKLGLGAPILAPYKISGKELNLTIWEKESPCPRRFPRKPGEARKTPWHG